MIRFLSRLAAPLSIAALLATAPAAHAGLVFSDGFENDASTTVLNFNGLLNWEVTDGRVDYIKDTNTFGLDCADDSAGCVDIDGSTFNAGKMVTKMAFELEAGTRYVFSVDLSGNQRNSGSDTITFGFDGGLGGRTVNLLGNVGFSTYLLEYTPSVTVSARLFIEDTTVGRSDNIGIIVDNVALNAVPEPGTLALLGLGLAALGLRRRRAA